MKQYCSQVRKEAPVARSVSEPRVASAAPLGFVESKSEFYICLSLLISWAAFVTAIFPEGLSQKQDPKDALISRAATVASNAQSHASDLWTLLDYSPELPSSSRDSLVCFDGQTHICSKSGNKLLKSTIRESARCTHAWKV